MLKVNEIFYSIQGESSLAGLPCIFIRLTYCNLRCTYCDTEYAFYVGKDYSIDELLNSIKSYNCSLVEVTGGEPLFQDESLELMKVLSDRGYKVMLETGGSLSIKDVDKRVKIIMDLKCPSSGMMKKNYYENISFLKQEDEVKFVIGSRRDYEWAKSILSKHNLSGRFTILFSCVFGKIEPVTLADWILEDNLNVRFQIQLHKIVWDPNRKGV